MEKNKDCKIEFFYFLIYRQYILVWHKNKFSQHNFSSSGRGIYRTEVTGGCCRACYKLVGEECGGIHDHSGVCRKGLECVSNETDPINKPQGICSKLN